MTNVNFSSLVARTCLLLCLLFFFTRHGISQEPAIFSCSTISTTLPSALSEPSGTCDYNPEHPNFENETRLLIGAGTPFPTASSIGNTLTGNVQIVGNFLVDAPFTFDNAVVAINPNVQIQVAPSFNPFDPTGGLLIDDSDLFSCTGLWLGIRMDPGAIVNTRNNSSIADALIAIRAINAGSLYIENTTFNRNWIGVDLTGNANSTPNVWTFSGNLFKCPLPVKVIQKPTFAGVILNNAIFTNFGSTAINRFQDLSFGIRTVGDLCILGGKNYRFERMVHDGIFMTHGVVHLQAPSVFINCNDNGLHIEEARSVAVSNAFFNYNTQLAEDLTIHRTGIKIEQFALNANIQIGGINFSANLNGTNNMVRGIHLIGGNVGAGTNIHINNSCLFNIKARSSQGIFLDGLFPITSTTEIFLNHFHTSTVDDDNGGAPVRGIEASGGDKNNLSIKWNTFSGFINGPNGNFSSSVYLNGSQGIQNEVSVNSYSDNTGYCGIYNEITHFQNTLYCSNNFNSLGGEAFFIVGQCMGSTFRANSISGCTDGFFLAIPNTFIGEQMHEGNQFFDLFFGNAQVGPVFHAFCQNLPQFNRFTVHTTQRVCGNPNDPACLFNPYFPERVEPNDPVNGYLFVTEVGTPDPGCMEQSSPPGEYTDALDRQIALGLLTSPIDEPALEWTLKRYLYQYFLLNPALAAEDAAFPAFMTATAGTPVALFHTVKQAMVNALLPDVVTDAQNKAAMGSMEALLVQVASLDEQISTASGTGLALLLEEKQALLNEMRTLLQTVNQSNASWRNQTVSALQSVQTANAALGAATQWAMNEKTINGIRIISWTQQGGRLTESQVQTLQAIAVQDPRQGGFAVYDAMGMLPECARPDNEFMRPSTPRHESRMSSRFTPVDSSTSLLQIVPNPVKDQFTVKGMVEGGAHLLLMDLTGKPVMSQSVSGTEATLVLPDRLPDGVYLLQATTAQGKTTTAKLMVRQ